MVAPLLGVLAPIIGTVIDRVIPDKNVAAEARQQVEAALIDNAAAINLAQVELNRAEAQHRSVFVAGWRPAIGWTCALGLFWAFIGQPVAQWATLMWGPPDLILPTIDTSILLELVLAMLGLGGLRTFEKLRGVASERLAPGRRRPS